MRTALISTLRRTHDGTPLAFLEMGGRSLAQWQMDMARRLGCETILCLASAHNSQIAALKDYAAEHGLQFHQINAMLQLVGHITADQEIVVITDGVIIDRNVLPEALKSGRGVLAVPAKKGLAIGLERIDATHAWAGVFCARGQIASQLADMPADSDIIALLLRLALQGRTPLVNLGEDALTSRSVILAQDESVLAERETSLLSRNGSSVSWWSPGQALAERAARLLAPRWLEKGPLGLEVLAQALLIAGVLASLLVTPVIGLPLLGVALIFWWMRRSLLRLKSKLFGDLENAGFASNWNWLFDISLIVCLVGLVPLNSAILPVASAIITVGLLRLSSALLTGRLAVALGDRLVWISVLGLGAAIGHLDRTEAIVSAALVICFIFMQRKIR